MGAERATSNRSPYPELPATDDDVAPRAVASCGPPGAVGLAGARAAGGAGGVDLSLLGDCERAEERGAVGFCRCPNAAVSIGASSDRRGTQPVRFTWNHPPRDPILWSSVPTLSLAITLPFGSARTFSPSDRVTDRSNPSRVVGLTELRMIQPVIVTSAQSFCTLPRLTVAASVSVPRTPPVLVRRRSVVPLMPVRFCAARGAERSRPSATAQAGSQQRAGLDWGA